MLCSILCSVSASDVEVRDDCPRKMLTSVSDADNDVRRDLGAKVDSAVLSDDQKPSSTRVVAAARRHHSMTSVDSRRTRAADSWRDDARDDVIATTPPQVRGAAATPFGQSEATSVLRDEVTTPSWLLAASSFQQQQSMDEAGRSPRSTMYTVESNGHQPNRMTSGHGSSVVVVVGNPVDIVTQTRSVSNSCLLLPSCC